MSLCSIDGVTVRLNRDPFLLVISVESATVFFRCYLDLENEMCTYWVCS